MHCLDLLLHRLECRGKDRRGQFGDVLAVGHGGLHAFVDQLLLHLDKFRGVLHARQGMNRVGQVLGVARRELLIGFGQLLERRGGMGGAFGQRVRAGFNGGLYLGHNALSFWS